MFCSNCGQQIPDNSAFCPMCGSKSSVADTYLQFQQMQQMQEAQAQYYQEQKRALRNSEIALLDAAITYFSDRIDLFNACDEAAKQVRKYSRNVKTPLLVSFGAVSAGLGTIYMLLGILGQVFSAIILCLLFLVVPGIIMLVCGIKTKKDRNKTREYYLEQQATAEAELHNYFMAYKNCPVGEAYIRPSVLCEIKDMIVSGRADTIKEVFELEAQNAYNEEYFSHLREIERNTASINRKATAATILSAARLFKR